MGIPELADDCESSEWLETFLAESSDRLRRAFVVRYGLEVGCEVHADTLVWAAENTATLTTASNPMGYLFRVGQSAARRYLRWSRRPSDLPLAPAAMEPSIEPGLPLAIPRLRAPERIAVFLVHGFGWTYAEVADLLDVSPSAVNNHVFRGLKKLRRYLGVDS